jgi:hypothetical protein
MFHVGDPAVASSLLLSADNFLAGLDLIRPPPCLTRL